MVYYNLNTTYVNTIYVGKNFMCITFCWQYLFLIPASPCTTPSLFVWRITLLLTWKSPYDSRCANSCPHLSWLVPDCPFPPLDSPSPFSPPNSPPQFTLQLSKMTSQIRYIVWYSYHFQFHICVSREEPAHVHSSDHCEAIFCSPSFIFLLLPSADHRHSTTNPSPCWVKIWWTRPCHLVCPRRQAET